MREEMPNGHWIELRDPARISKRQREPVELALQALPALFFDKLAETAKLEELRRESEDPEKAAEFTEAARSRLAELADSFTEDETRKSWALNEAIAVTMIEAWSYDEEITVDGLKDIPDTDAYRAIVTAVAPFVGRLILNTAPDGVKPSEGSPTSPSAPSGSGRRASRSTPPASQPSASAAGG